MATFSSSIMRRDAAKARFRVLRGLLVSALEALEPQARFTITAWDRQGGGGGERGMVRGEALEKAGVHLSEVYGDTPEPLRGVARADGSRMGATFWAAGLSAIVHPRNPHAPSGHLNVRRIETGDRGWFGGGADLTPTLATARRRDSEDAQDFHQTLRQACGEHWQGWRDWCDRYFVLPHRDNMTRGVGGVFFDDYQSGDFAADLAQVAAVAEAFIAAYPRIVARRLAVPWGAAERDEQAHWRARYVEFNLLYDRGSRFGLQSGGDTEAILSSLPPVAAWR